jgi:hypothetical protein
MVYVLSIGLVKPLRLLLYSIDVYNSITVLGSPVWLTYI